MPVHRFPQRCLITGIKGFTGRHLAAYLCELTGVEVFGLDSPRRLQAGADGALACDLTDKAATHAALSRVQPQAVFHLAGKTRGQSLGELRAANVETTRVLLELAADFGYSILVPGSAAEYGFPRELPLRETHPLQPVTPYGMSKAEQTALALDFAQRGASAFLPRPFNLVGPGLPESFAPAELVGQVVRLRDGQALTVSNPDTRRDFVDVRDLVRAYWEILTHGRPGEVYNLCTGRGLSLEEIARVLLGAAGRPAPLERGAQTDPPEGTVIVGSPEKIQGELDWTPCIPLADSLRDMLGEYGSAAS